MAILDYKVGDILLINNKSKMQSFNINGQRLIRKTKNVNATHVALSLGNGIFIHADAATGVDLVFFADILEQSDGKWRVIRPPFINAENEETLKKEAIYHFSKAYNYGFLGQEKYDALFCSQLVDKVFQSLGFHLFKHTNAFPVDFENLSNSSQDWIDVTKFYSDGLTDNTFKLLRPQYFLRKTMVSISQRQNAASNGMINTLKEIVNLSNSLPEYQREKVDLKDIESSIKELEEEIGNRLYNFWNDDLNDFSKRNS